MSLLLLIGYLPKLKVEAKLRGLRGLLLGMGSILLILFCRNLAIMPFLLVWLTIRKEKKWKR